MLLVCIKGNSVKPGRLVESWVVADSRLSVRRKVESIAVAVFFYEVVF